MFSRVHPRLRFGSGRWEEWQIDTGSPNTPLPDFREILFEQTVQRSSVGHMAIRAVVLVWAFFPSISFKIKLPGRSHPCLHWGMASVRYGWIHLTGRCIRCFWTSPTQTDSILFFPLKPQKSCRCCTQKRMLYEKEITLSLVFEEDYDLAWPHYGLGENISGNTN